MLIFISNGGFYGKNIISAGERIQAGFDSDTGVYDLRSYLRDIDSIIDGIDH